IGYEGPAAACFRLRLADASLGARIIERGVALRTAWLGLPYGDQGLVISRQCYDRLGGFAPLPLMEDVDLVRRLCRRVAMLPRAPDHRAVRRPAPGVACPAIRRPGACQLPPMLRPAWRVRAAAADGGCRPGAPPRPTRRDAAPRRGNGRRTLPARRLSAPSA